MKGKIKYLILAIALVFLVLPKPALAVIGTGIFDFFETAISGISALSEPVVARLLQILFVYIIGLIFLYTSASLLEITTQHPEWLSISNNAMVSSGWHFTSGIANMFLILILIFIAFAFILKIETFQAKKALPRLIIVALLMNFSLVFIGMLVDIANIFYNTILTGNKSLPSQIINMIGAGGESLMKSLLIWLGALAAAFIIPVVAPFAKFALVVGVIGFGFIPNILTWVFQIFCFFSISGMFFIYAFLFGARVFIIQLLAILSPIAFLCLILPQTKKYWDEWLQHLVQWITFGVILFFFLVIGLRAANFLVPTYGPTPTPIFGWFQIKAYFVYYFFLFVYLVVALWLSKKYMPTIASALIEQGKAVGGFILTRGLKPWGRAMWQQTEEEAIKQREKEKAAKAAGRKLTFGEKMKSLFTTTPVRTAYYLRGTTIEEEALKKMTTTAKEGEEIRDVELLTKKIRGAIRLRNDAAAIGLVSAAIEKGGIFKKRVMETLSKDEVVKLGFAANTLGAGKEAGRIGRAFIDLADRMGFKSLEQLKKEYDNLKRAGKEKEAAKKEQEIKEWEEKGYKTIKDKLIGEAEKNEVKDFTKGFWRDPAAMEAIQKFWGGPQLSRAADEFGKGFVDDYMKVIEKLKPEELLKINPRALIYLTGNPAQDLGFRPPEGLTREKVQDTIKFVREEIPPARMPTEVDLKPLKDAIEKAFPSPPSAPPPGTPPASTPPEGRPGVGPTPEAGPTPRPPRGRPGVGGP